METYDFLEIIKKMKTSASRNRGVATLAPDRAKDFITVSKRRMNVTGRKNIQMLHQMKYAAESPIVNSATSQMYSIGTAPRFVTPKSG